LSLSSRVSCFSVLYMVQTRLSNFLMFIIRDIILFLLWNFIPMLPHIQGNFPQFIDQFYDPSFAYTSRLYKNADYCCCASFLLCAPIPLRTLASSTTMYSH
jgi:hypothetical protein